MNMRYIRIVLTLALVLVTSLKAQELIILSTPETKPSNSNYAIDRLTLTLDKPATVPDEGIIYIQLLGQNSESLSCTYDSTTTPKATALLDGLNKANLSSAYAGNATTGSLKQRIFHRLVVMNEAATVCGKALTGTIGGAVP